MAGVGVAVRAWEALCVSRSSGPVGCRRHMGQKRAWGVCGLDYCSAGFLRKDYGPSAQMGLQPGKAGQRRRRGRRKGGEEGDGGTDGGGEGRGGLPAGRRRAGAARVPDEEQMASWRGLGIRPGRKFTANTYVTFYTTRRKPSALLREF